MSNDATNNDQAGRNKGHSSTPAESGYGSPTPEDEMPAGATNNPGSADPTLRGQETDEEALDDDSSLGVPDRNFLQDEDAGSDGEPGAGALGGTENQLHAEMDESDADAARVDPSDESPLEAPSTDAPQDEGNADTSNSDRESFSSESDDDASGS